MPETPAPDTAGPAAPADLPVLELLYEAPGLPAYDLPAELAASYGGSLGFTAPCLFTNFVQTIDGVVAIPSLPSSNKLIAGESAADRFVLGLLRACCDVLLIGSGTLAASPRSVWTPEQAYPAAAAAFAALRQGLGRTPVPLVAVVSGSGRVDPDHPVFAAGALVLTTDAGAEQLAGRLAGEAVLSLGERLEPAGALAALHDRGLALVLCEGGPRTIAPFLAAGLVDELFLTISPLLVGRVAGDQRLALVEGADLLPGGPLAASLLGLRRAGGHLFHRYELETSARPNGGAGPRPGA